MQSKGGSTPFILKKINKKLKDIPTGNINKNKFKKKQKEIPYRKAPASINNKSLSVKKENDNFYYNNYSNRPRKNMLSKDNIFYNKSFKDLNKINNNDINNELNYNLNNIENKKELREGGDFIENGMSQNEINSNSNSQQIYKNINFEEKERNKNSRNLLINSQIEKRDKESVDNLKSFLNKLIDDLDN